MNEMDEFHALRGKAIHEYATLEGSLIYILSKLLESDHQTAAIVFFKIANSRSRSMILSELLEKKYERKYRKFWNSIDKLIKDADSTRNSIVHWHMSPTGFDEDIVPKLVPPAFWIYNESNQKVSELELLEFITKCRFIYRHLIMFYFIALCDNEFDESVPWLEIFSQELVYQS